MSGRIIKGSTKGAVLAGPVLDARQAASALLEEARQQAADRVARAEAQAASIRAQAREEGRQQGLGEAAAVLVQARRERDALLGAAEAELVETALAVAEKVIGQAARRDPAAVKAAAAEALAALRQQKGLVLKVHPDDAVAAGEVAASARVPVAVVAEPSLAQGGCVLESQGGTVDARVETKLAVIREALTSP